MPFSYQAEFQGRARGSRLLWQTGMETAKSLTPCLALRARSVQARGWARSERGSEEPSEKALETEKPPENPPREFRGRTRLQAYHRKKQTMESVSVPVARLGSGRKEGSWRDSWRELLWRKEAATAAGGAQVADSDAEN